MTGNGFEVSPDHVRSSASDLRAVADRLSQAVQSFQGEVTGLGDCWGADDIGMIIGTAHAAVFEGAMECFTTNLDEITGHAETLGVVADNYVQMEDTNKLYVNKINELL
ncbi:WXG100 family type VII secretion target [Actinomadura sp. 6N118]|uniref:WXG100 family type VII secretion target n=1 Tax=Actinomadura sp. 6N118 TaxID=3375151 RepID=UPI0037BC22A4